MPKKKNSEASEKRSDQCEKMEAKHRCESTPVSLQKAAFEGVGDEGQLVHAASATQSSGANEGPQHPGPDESTGSAQRRDLKAYTPPSPDEVKDRLIAGRRREPSNPLGQLARAERDLHARSAALTKLSSPQQKRPDKNLLVHQLTQVIDTSRVPKSMAPQLKEDVVALYSALQSSDPTDSILNRLTVAMVNSVMDCHARAVQTGNPKAIDTNLRHVVKGTKAVIDLVEARERRRGPKQIMVGKVNAEAGGQPIVGDVKPKSKDASKRETDPILRSITTKRETGD